MEDAAIVRIETKLDNVTQMLTTLSNGHQSLDLRVQALERADSGMTAWQQSTDRTLGLLTERRPAQWPVVMSTIISAVMALLFVAGLLYLGPGAR